MVVGMHDRQKRHITKINLVFARKRVIRILNIDDSLFSYPGIASRHATSV